jgi:hypothetical protein
MANLIPKGYFEHSEGSTTEDGSQEGVREANRSEVTLTTFYMADINWKDFWSLRKPPYKEPAMNTMFFHPFLATNDMDVAMQ